MQGVWLHTECTMRDTQSRVCCMHAVQCKVHTHTHTHTHTHKRTLKQLGLKNFKGPGTTPHSTATLHATFAGDSVDTTHLCCMSCAVCSVVVQFVQCAVYIPSRVHRAWRMPCSLLPPAQSKHSVLIRVTGQWQACMVLSHAAKQSLKIGGRLSSSTKPLHCVGTACKRIPSDATLNGIIDSQPS
jgi:hypothetical protein